MLPSLIAEAEDRYFSTGRSCELLRIVPSQLASLMDELRIEFDHYMDDVGVLRGDQLEEISERINEYRYGQNK